MPIFLDDENILIYSENCIYKRIYNFIHININNTQLFFDVYGAKLTITKDTIVEKPTLIVLHGGHGFADHTLYVEFWSQFSNFVQVIFIDQRGCGRSPSSIPSEWNLQQWADDLYQFCLALKIEKPIIAGVSMGGHVMCELVNKHSDLPGGLIFCNTQARFPLDRVCKKLYSLGGVQPENACREFYTNPNMSTFEDYVKYCIPYYAKNAYTPAELNRCIKNLDVFLHYCQNEMLKFNYLSEMNKIQCPTLLLVGEESLHVVEAAEEMVELIDHKFVAYKLFKGTGAPGYKDMPEESYEVVSRFLGSINNINGR